MASNKDIFSREWCELVFDPKYREYGGYELRTNSSGRHFRALVIASVAFILIVSAPYLIKHIFPKKVEKDTTVRILSEINLEKPKEENILRELPPPPVLLRNSIKFVPPVVKPDEQVADDQMLTQKEVIEEKAAISNVTFDKGTDDISAPVANAENKKITEEKEVPLIVAEQMPQFPGGDNEMMRFIKSNLHYPVHAQENGVQGTVIVNFVVNREGKITNIKVVRGIGFGCDEESIKVMERMPAWSPGKQRGQAVSVSFTMPIRFVLN